MSYVFFVPNWNKINNLISLLRYQVKYISVVVAIKYHYPFMLCTQRGGGGEVWEVKEGIEKKSLKVKVLNGCGFLKMGLGVKDDICGNPHVQKIYIDVYVHLYINKYIRCLWFIFFDWAPTDLKPAIFQSYNFKVQYFKQSRNTEAKSKMVMKNFVKAQINLAKYQSSLFLHPHHS